MLLSLRETIELIKHDEELISLFHLYLFSLYYYVNIKYRERKKYNVKLFI